MTSKGITWIGVGLRFLATAVLVFSTYNPEGLSYIDWAFLGQGKSEAGSDLLVLKIFVGVVLLIGWIILLRATWRSLGPFGLVLAVAFFGTLIWLVVDWGLVPANSIRAVTYIILVVLCGVLAMGVSWSLIRRRITGQVDVDEIENG